MKDILLRISKIADNEGITITGLERKIGASKGVLSRALLKNTDIQTKWIARIVENYPQYNADWILTGKGEMLKKNYEIKVHYNPKNEESIVEEDINIYDVNASGNLQTLFELGQQNIIGKIRIPNLSHCDGAIYLRGDSMYPLLKSGDIIIYKMLNNIENLAYGEMYLIDYSIDGDDYLTVKYINASDIENHIRLVSYNQHFSPMDIPLSSVRSLAIIKASIRFNTLA